MPSCQASIISEIKKRENNNISIADILRKQEPQT